MDAAPSPDPPLRLPVHTPLALAHGCCRLNCCQYETEVSTVPPHSTAAVPLPWRITFPSQSMFAMAIHMEVEYAKRFEGGQEDLDGGSSKSDDGDGDDKEARSPLPPKTDVSWAHILAQNQVRRRGC